MSLENMGLPGVALAKTGAVILAAGKGTRLGCTDIPKVMLEIGGKPIVSYIVETLKNLGFNKEQIVLVVGFQKEKVKEYFGDSVTYADQEEQLGTAHAAYTGMKGLPESIESVLVLGGDDSAFYTVETLEKFINNHLENRNTLSLLTTEPENYKAMGRVVRNENEEFVGVLEKEQLVDDQKGIKEVSTGTYIFDRQWFENIFPNMGVIEGVGEYGLPKAIEMAREEGKKIKAIKLDDNSEWFGINTLEELEEANERKK